MLFALLFALAFRRSRRHRHHTNDDEAWHQLKFLKPEQKASRVEMRQMAEKYLKEQTRKNMRHELRKAARQHQTDVIRLALYKALDIPLSVHGPEFYIYEKMMKMAEKNKK